jgi:hypothetical protein
MATERVKLDDVFRVRRRAQPVPGWYLFDAKTGAERAGPFDTEAKARKCRRELVAGKSPRVSVVSWDRSKAERRDRAAARKGSARGPKSPAEVKARVVEALDAIASARSEGARMKAAFALHRLEWALKKAGSAAGFCPECGAKGLSRQNVLNAAIAREIAAGAGRHGAGCRLEAALEAHRAAVLRR